MKQIHKFALLLLAMSFACTDNSITKNENGSTIEINLADARVFSGKASDITPLKLWDRQFTYLNNSSLSKAGDKISFNKALAISINMSPYLFNALSGRSDSSVLCELLNANYSSFANHRLRNWDTLVSAFHNYNMCTVTDVRELEKDGIDFVKGYMKVNSGINWIIVAFTDQFDSITHTSAARYIYMDKQLEQFSPNGERWSDGFVTSGNSVWTTGQFQKKNYPAKGSDYTSFSAYNLPGFGSLGISQEYASYKCANPNDTSLTDTTPVTVPKSWKKADSLSLIKGKTGKESIVFRTINDTNPIVACIDSGRGNAIIIMQKSISGWDSIGQTPPSVTDFAMAVSNDTIFLAFTDNTQAGKISIWKFGGDSWSVMNTGISSGAALALSMSFTALSQPCISFADLNRAGLVSVITFNPTTHQFVQDTAIPQSSGVSATSISVSTDSRIFVAIAKSTGSKGLSIYQRDTAWKAVDTTLTASTVDVSSPSLTATDNELYLAYIDGSISRNAHFRAKALTGSTFDQAASPVNADSSIVVARSKNPISSNIYIAYRDNNNNGKATVIYSSGASESWRPVGKNGFSDNAVASIQMTVSGKEVPWMITREGTKTIVYKYDR